MRTDLRPGAMFCWLAVAGCSGQVQEEPSLVARVERFEAKPQAAAPGQPVVLSWNVKDAHGVNIEPMVGLSGAVGSTTVYPYSTTVFTLTALGSSEPVRSQLTVDVRGGAPIFESLTGRPLSIDAGEPAILSWSARQATYVVVEPELGQHPPQGRLEVRPAVTTTYRFTAHGVGGATADTIRIVVRGETSRLPEIKRFEAVPDKISEGATSVLEFETTRATSVTIEGLGAQTNVGQVEVRPDRTKTYVLEARNEWGMVRAETTLEVRAISAPSIIDFTGPTQISEGASAELMWSTVNATRVVIEPGVGAQEPNGRITVRPRTRTSYTLVATGGGGESMATHTIDVIAPDGDSCESGFLAMPGSFTGDSSTAAADYDPGPGGCTGAAAAGPDLAYRIELEAGQRLLATLETTGWDGALYLVTGCQDVVTQCVAGTDRQSPEILEHTATADGEYTLIVDGTATGGPYTLNLALTPAGVAGESCDNPTALPPGGGTVSADTTNFLDHHTTADICTGQLQPGPDAVYSIRAARGDVLEVTAAFDEHDGSVYTAVGCGDLAVDCKAGADRSDSGESESLRLVAQTDGDHLIFVDSQDAAEAGPFSLVVSNRNGDTCSAAPTLNIDGTPEWFTTEGLSDDYTPGNGGCTGFTATGADRSYAVTLDAGAQVIVEANVGQGFDPSLYLLSDCSAPATSCVLGSDTVGAITERLGALVQEAGTYHLVVDGFAGSEGSGTIAATVHSGETCADAYELMAPRYLGTTLGYAHNVGTSDQNISCTDYAQSGPDAVFALQLQGGQTIEATVAAPWDAAIYLRDGCGAQAMCVAGSDAGTQGSETVRFTHPPGPPADYYLVIDAWTAGLGGAYTLDVVLN